MFMFVLLPLFAYFGPETYLPVTSVIATVVGFCMTFSRIGARYAKRVIDKWVERSARSASMPRPHFRVPLQALSLSSRAAEGAPERGEG
jgi:hypothetical protein